MVAIAGVDADGNAISSGLKTQAQDLLQSYREVTFIVNTFDPTTTIVDVQYDVDMWPGNIAADTQDAIESIIASYLNPATWGIPLYSGIDEPTLWYSAPNVKIDNMIATVGRVAAVQNVNSVTIRTGVGSYAAADITLAGRAPLAKAGTVSGTVH